MKEKTKAISYLCTMYNSCVWNQPCVSSINKDVHDLMVHYTELELEVHWCYILRGYDAGSFAQAISVAIFYVGSI